MLWQSKRGTISNIWFMLHVTNRSQIFTGSKSDNRLQDDTYLIDINDTTTFIKDLLYKVFGWNLISNASHEQNPVFNDQLL